MKLVDYQLGWLQATSRLNSRPGESLVASLRSRALHVRMIPPFRNYQVLWVDNPFCWV